MTTSDSSAASAPARSKVLSFGLWIATGVALGRILGLAREALLARNLGATPAADLAAVLLSLPDILMTLLVGGAVEAIFIPVFRTLSFARARALFWRLQGMTAIIAIVIAAVLSGAAEEILPLLLPGITSARFELSARLLSITFWTLPFAASTAICAAFLQSQERFAWVSMGSVIVNAILIIGLAIMFNDGSSDIEGMSLLTDLPIWILIAFSARLIPLLIWSWSPRDHRVRSNGAVDEVGDRYIYRIWLRKYAEALFAGSVIALFPVFARAAASAIEPGAAAVFTYAVKLVEVPAGVFLAPIAIALLPSFADTKDRNDAPPQLRAGVRLSGLFSLPLITGSLGLAWGFGSMPPEFGVLEPKDVQRILGWLAVLSLSLPFRGAMGVYVAYWNSRHLTHRNLVITLLGLGVLLLGSLLAIITKSVDVLPVATTVAFMLMAGVASLWTRSAGLDGSKRLVSWSKELLPVAGILCGTAILLTLSPFSWVIKISVWGSAHLLLILLHARRFRNLLRVQNEQSLESL